MRSDRGETVAERAGLMRVWRRADISLDAVLAALATPGHTLKRSAKSHTRRCGGNVVKTSEGPFAAQLIKHTVQRERYRRGWRAALFLAARGIPAPRPVAHVEWGIAGLVWRHATIMEFISDCQDVEHYYDAQARAGAPYSERAAYLARLATAVNGLAATGAHHADLAGKNILTRDGESFYFIDLDAIALGTSVNIDERFEQQVQLYDSFVDRCDAALLEGFLRELRTPGLPSFDTWLARIKTAQSVRRARTVAAWKREGKA